MYNQYDGLPISLTNMTFQQCFRLAVAAIVPISALNLHAQSTHVADMDTGSTITSLTNLKSHRHASAPFGSIDATSDDGVALDVSMAPDSSSSKSAGQLQSGRALGHSVPNGSIPPQLVAPNLLQGRNLGGMTGSVAVANASSVQSSSGQTLRSASPQSTALSTSFQSPHSASPQALQSVGATPQGGSISNASTASKINGLPAPSEVNSGRDVSGSSRSLSSLTSSLSHQSNLGALAHSSHSHEFASDRTPDDAFSLKMDASASESSTLSEDKQEPAGFFEAVKDPFGGELKNPFAGNRKHFGLERVCGDVCLPETSSGDSENATLDMSESARSTAPSDRSALRLYGGSGTLLIRTHSRRRFQRGTSIRNSIAEAPEEHRKP